MPQHSLPQPPSSEAFTHIRIIMGIVLGLGVSRLLVGLSRFVQHPGRCEIFIPHLIWVAFMIVAIIRFWWFEFYLRHIPEWTFATYAFLFLYSSLYFIASSLLFPDSMGEYSGYREYFMSRRIWFFGLLLMLFLLDVFDTHLKGREYVQQLGVAYFWHCSSLLAMCALGMRSGTSAGQVAIACLSLASLVIFTVRLFVPLC